MGDRLRLAILGPGDVAQRDYLPEFGRIADRAEIVAVCGRTEARARAVAEQHGAPWFTDEATMLEEARIDALVNLTPIQSHFETTLMALEAGVHVYSEKPLAGSVAEGRRVEQDGGRAGSRAGGGAVRDAVPAGPSRAAAPRGGADRVRPHRSRGRDGRRAAVAGIRLRSHPVLLARWRTVGGSGGVSAARDHGPGRTRAAGGRR